MTPTCIGTPEVTHLRQDAVDERDPDGMTALHRAAAAGEIDSCLRLMDAGADVNARSGMLMDVGVLSEEGHWVPGDTPLILAAQSGRSDVVALLLGRGADATLFNRMLKKLVSPLV